MSLNRLLPTIAVLGMTAALTATLTAPAHAQLLIDSFNATGSNAIQFGVSNSPLARVSVSAPVTITQIGSRVDLIGNGNLKFLIFNAGTSTLLFSTPAQAFVDNGMGYKVSNAFAPFALSSGIDYAIGAVADVDGLWSLDSGNPSVTANNITVAGNSNSNVTNFANPTLTGSGTVKIHIQLFGPGAAAAAPEPGSLALFGIVLGGIGIGRRRK